MASSAFDPVSDDTSVSPPVLAPPSDRDDLLGYYERELSYLREAGAEFASRHPTIGTRLGLHGSESRDPHTERLIEAFAFLSARVHRDLDQELPQLAHALLDNLCPSLAQPLPSMTIARFVLDPDQGRVMAGFHVPRHTSLAADAPTGRPCRFRTAWETVVWPIEVAHVARDADDMLRLTLRCNEHIDFSELEIDHLRFHLHGDLAIVMPLYDALTAHRVSVTLAPTDSVTHTLPPDALREVGFEEDEEILPRPAHAQPAYGLLQEYLAFPRKFHFFDLQGLRGRLGGGRHCDLLIHFDRALPVLSKVDARHFALGCTPVINLFAKTSEPLWIDDRHHEHPLVADRQRADETEVHSILAVTASDPDTASSIDIPSFAAAGRFGMDATAFWSSRRTQTLSRGSTGTDVHLAFVDRAHMAQRLREPVVCAHLLCTNRQWAEQVLPGTPMTAEGPTQPVRGRCLYAPTPQHDPPLDTETLWRLVSLMTLNHVSLVDAEEGRQRLQEMLHLLAAERHRDHPQIRAIKHLASRPATARLCDKAWRGHARGTEVEIELDEQAFAGGSSLLMAAVLARFFALYASVNSFVRLVVKQGDDTRKRWQPLIGRQAIL